MNPELFAIWMDLTNLFNIGKYFKDLDTIVVEFGEKQPRFF